jgi:hypothetical protein
VLALLQNSLPQHNRCDYWQGRGELALGTAPALLQDFLPVWSDLIAEIAVAGEVKAGSPHLENNQIGEAGADSLGVLGQCAALTYLDLQDNEIEAVGEGRLRASWRGQASGLVLVEDEELTDDDDEQDEDEDGDQEV